MNPGTAPSLVLAAVLWLVQGAGTNPQGKTLALPEPMEPAGLSRLLLDQPQNVVVLDVRPTSHFSEFAIPGSKNVAPDALVDRVRAHEAEKILVLVDRDGTSAFAYAGALLARGDTPRVRALVGGVTRWYREIELERGAVPTSSQARSEPAGTTSRPSTPEAKKRNAGC